MSDEKQMPPWHAAALRNRGPILQCLQKIVQVVNPTSSHALEIASGTGAHLALNAPAFPDITWHPTDFDPTSVLPEALTSPNACSPEMLDASQPVALWPESVRILKGSFSLVLCVNMIHISPPESTTGLFEGSSEVLATGGLLVLYGPFFEYDKPTAPGNISFDESLRSRDPRWGIRKLEDVSAEARGFGLELSHREEMPANNLVVAFRKS